MIIYVLLELSVDTEDPWFECECNLEACACLSCSFSSLIACISFFSFMRRF